MVPILDFKKIFEWRDKENRDDAEGIEEKNKELGSDQPKAVVLGLSDLDQDLPDWSTVRTENRVLLKDSSALLLGADGSVEWLQEMKIRKDLVVEMLNTTYISDEEGEESEEEETTKPELEKQRSA